MRLNKKQIICSILLFSVIAGFLLFQGFTLDQSYSQSNRNNKIRMSNSPALNQDFISINESRIFSLFESTFIEINTTQFSDQNPNKATVQFLYSGGISDIYEMNPAGDLFNFTYTAPYYAPTGDAIILFQIYNDDLLLNANTTENVIYIDSHYYAAKFVKDELYTNETLDVALTIKNVSNFELTYDISIVNSTDSMNQDTIIDDIDENVIQFNKTIERSLFQTLDKYYYVKVDLRNNTGPTNSAYFQFKVLNHSPEINSSTLIVPDEIYRTRDFDISINVSDRESNAQNLNVSAQLITPLGIKLDPIEISGDLDNNFTLTLNIPKNRPIGNYRLNITARDPDGGVTFYNDYINVQNLLPIINSFKINGLSQNQPISIFYGNDLNFTFNVSDTDGSIEYVTVSLLNEDGEWFNITKKYTQQNFEILIRSEDLITGNWYVYISITDSNGGTNQLTSDIGQGPQQIRIIPDALGEIIPWITLIIGLIMGFLIGTVLAYKILQLRTREKVESIKEKSKKAPSKPMKKSPKEGKPSQKEEEPEEKEEKPTKKKIKRRL